MNAFSHVPSDPKQGKTRKSPSPGRGRKGTERMGRKPQLEALEDRCLPSSSTISGFVYRDNNNNGIFDPGEKPLADSEIELRNAAGVVIGTTKTNAQGFYEFTSDPTISTTPTSSVQTVSIPQTDAGFTEIREINQFDPSLGELLEVEIVNQGSITSTVKIENILDKPTSMAGVVTGTIKLTGPGFALEHSVTQNVSTFEAARFDGTIDFQGSSGKSFPPVMLNLDAKSVTLTGDDLRPFIGTGKLQLTEDVEVKASASGGGNWVAGAISTATATFTVRYKYRPKNNLQPGDYTIIQKAQPPLSPGSSAKYLDGKVSRNNIPLPNSVGTNQIPITLGNSSLTNNNFAEIYPSTLSGWSFIDDNGNGVRDSGEQGLGNAVIRLSGKNDLGQDVQVDKRTRSDGSFIFWDLRPGTYTLSQLPVNGYVDGQDRAGTLGGTATSSGITGIVVAPAKNGRDYTFGNLRRSSLSGFVFSDTDADGVRDTGEAGISGVQVTLTGVDNTGPITKTTTTGNDGTFTFNDLRAGTYAVSIATPTGYLHDSVIVGNRGGVADGQQITDIFLEDGTSGSGYGFGELKGASLAGAVYRDVNDNGSRDGNEGGIQGVQIRLVGTDNVGTVERSTTTDATGVYRFEGLRPGVYSISEVQPEGWLDGKDSLGNRGGTVGNDVFDNIALGTGLAGTGYNFGERPANGLSGYVYHDANNNGIKDQDENGIADAVVKLTGVTATGTVNREVKTDQSGFYQFEGLVPGIYSLGENQPSGFLDGKDTLGSAGGTLENDRVTGITVTETTRGTGYNFGELRSASLSGKVFLDEDGDGFQTTGELGLAGVKLTLHGFTARGEVTRETTTANDGSYSFGNLEDGSYSITQTQPSGYADGQEIVGTLGGDPGINRISNIVVSQGAQGVGYHFTEYRQASLSGVVFEDLDNDGVQDTGEKGLQGAVITLTGETDNGPVSRTAITGIDGKYSFVGLAPGLYTLEKSYESCHEDGLAIAGTAGGFALDGNTITGIVLSSGEKGERYLFAEHPEADLSINRTFSESPVQPEATITYTITVTNHGPCSARDVLVEEMLPPGFTLVPGSPAATGFTVSTTGNKLTFARPEMQANTSSTITFRVKVSDQTGSYTDTIKVTSKTPDDNPSDNTQTSTIKVVPGQQQVRTGGENDPNVIRVSPDIWWWFYFHR